MKCYYEIRSKARVKRLLKQPTLFGYNPVSAFLQNPKSKTGRRIRPVSWHEIVAHGIDVSDKLGK